MSKSLPPQPNLEHLKKLAKALLKSHKESQPEATSRIKEHHPRLSSSSESDILGQEFSLQDAQLVIAREYGFGSWPKLVAVVAESDDTRSGMTKDQIWVVLDLHDEYARLLRSAFTEIMQREVNVAVAFVDQATYAECIQSLDDPSCACRFTMQSGNNQAILDMGWPVVSALLNPFSRTGKDIREGDHSPLGPSEIVTVNGTTQRLLKELESVFGSIRMIGAELEFSPTSLRIADAEETCVIVCFEVLSDVKPEEVEGRRERRGVTQEEIDSFLDAASKCSSGSGVVTLIYPVSTIESVLSHLRQPA